MVKLDKQLGQLQLDYEAGLRRSAEFVAFHLKAGMNGLDNTLQELDGLLQGVAPHSPCHFISFTGS